MYPTSFNTSRLYIRPLQKEDALLWADFFKHAEAVEFLPKQPDKTNLQKAEFWIDKQLTRYKENRFGLMALINNRTKDFVGQCGLLTQELEGKPVLEIGYHLFPKFWGNGFATEAAIAFKNLAFSQDYNTEIVSLINIGNVKSEKVAINNGMTIAFQATFWNEPVNVFKIKKKDWVLRQDG